MPTEKLNLYKFKYDKNAYKLRSFGVKERDMYINVIFISHNIICKVYISKQRL